VPTTSPLPLRITYAGDDGSPRTADFAEFLRSRFVEVAVERVTDLGSLDLSSTDVLVVDGETDLEQMWAPQLPERLNLDDFPVPTLLIGPLGGQVGDKLGLKVARLQGCVCLKESAIVGGTWGRHPVFHGPFDVPEVEPRLLPTPPYLARGSKADAVGDHIPVVDMHAPVSRSAFEGSDELTAARQRGDAEALRALLRGEAPIGLVSNPAGLLDSPDCEWILGGINTKAVDYVAVGRHGRFLLWGFAAQPSALTQVGKALLSNAIAYIAGFAGAPCEALRVSQSRELLWNLLHQLPDTANLADLGLALPEQMGATVAEALSGWEPLRGFLRYAGGAPRGRWIIDEELRAIGLRSDDPELPGRLAEQLDVRGEAGERARSLWRRYLRREPVDAAAERAWLDAQPELFFSDWAGFRWISRTDLPHLVPPRFDPQSHGVVDAVLHAHRDIDGRVSASVRLTVNDGYYVYPPGSSEGLGLSVAPTGDCALALAGPVSVLPQQDHLTRADVSLVLEGPGDELSLDIRTQACDAQQCLVPTTFRVTCPITTE
jgi:hypothetical protein